MASKRILYISQEIFPYLPETEISYVSRFLPQAIQEKGNEVRIFMPRYGLVNERRNQLHEVIRLSGINLIINDKDHPLIIKVASIQSARMQVYFIDNDDFFKRKYTYRLDSKTTDNDNDERSIFFVRGVFEAIKKLRWIPDVIHCHGLFTALAVLYLKKLYSDDPCLRKSKIVYSVYNEENPANITDHLFEKLKFDGIKGSSISMMDGKSDYTSLTKMAVAYSNGIVVGDPQISDEISSYIKDSGKHILEYVERDNYGDPYDEFYNSLLK